MRVLLFLLFLLGAPPAFAAETKAQAEKEALKDNFYVRPIVSPKGIQRIYDGIKELEKNIADATANLTICDRNREVVIAELQDLDKLEKEQVELIGTYQKYLDDAKIQTAKNNEGAEAVMKFEAEARKQLEGKRGKNQLDVASKLNTARLDRVNRERWKADAKGKVERVNKLLQMAQKNLNDIRARRAPLRGQVSGWSTRKAEFQKLIKTLQAKKVEMQTLAENRKRELPDEYAKQLESPEKN